MKWWVKSLVEAAIIVVAGFISAYIINHKLSTAVTDLPIYTAGVGLLTILGRIMGTLSAVSGAGRASIVSPGVAKYAHGASRKAAEEIDGGWVTHLLAIVLAIFMYYIISAYASQVM